MRALIAGTVGMAFFAFLFPAAARGADAIGVVSVADPPAGPGPELAWLTQQLRSEVAQQAQGVLDADRLRDRMTGRLASSSLGELDTAYAGALAAAENGDFEGSVRTLRAVIDDLERLPETSETFNQWTRAMMRLAWTESTIGHAAEMKEVLERLAKAAPGIKADRSQYPPRFGKQLDDTAAALRSLPKHKLIVQTNPPGKKTDVFIDGRNVGQAPVTALVPSGKYRVSGSQGALRMPGMLVEVAEADKTVALDFSLTAAMRPDFGPGLALAEPERSKGIVTAGAWLGVDRLLTASLVTESGVTMLVGSAYDVRHGTLQREGRIRLSGKAATSGHLSALAAFLVKGQSDPVVAVANPEGAFTFTEPMVTPGNPYKTVGWTAVGTGVLFVGMSTLAIMKGSSANGSYDKARGLMDAGGSVAAANRAAYTQYLSDGDSAKKTATIGAVGAGISLVATGVLGYLAYKQAGEVGPFRF